MGYWIVVVDDEVIELKNAKNLLSSEDMRISCLRSGADLLKFMDNNSPDLILLDVLMPDMGGFETFHALREIEEKKQKAPTPVFFLTGDNDKDTERRGLKDGASDFIRKPIDKEILLSRIAKIIEYNKTIEQLKKTASFDKLTGFLNKASGAEQIADKCRNNTGVMMLLDLDNFKLINDIYGHDMGDQVLITLSEIIKHNTRAEDIICRIGGDEFLGFFENFSSRSAVKALSDRLNEQLIQACLRLMGDDFDVPIGISIGAVFVPECSRDYQRLFKYADSAMYRVKQNGKHGVWIFDEELSREAHSTNDLNSDMARINKLLEERAATDGAMVIGKDAFIHNYHFAMRFLQRYKKGAAKVLFSLFYGNQEENIADLTSRFITLLQEKLRSSDTIVQIRSDQVLVFMPDISQEDVNEAAKKIEEDALNSISNNLHIEFVSEYISFE